MGWGTGVPVGFAAAAGGFAVGACAWFLSASPEVVFISALAGGGVTAYYVYKKFVKL